MISVLNGSGFVSRVNHGNDDLTVVNAARVSNSKRVDAFIYTGHPEERTQRTDLGMTADDRLVKYLATNGHWTPFGHVRFTYAVLPSSNAAFLRWYAGLEDRASGWAWAFVGRQMYLSGSLWNWMQETPPVAELRRIRQHLTKAAPFCMAHGRDLSPYDHPLDSRDIGPTDTANILPGLHPVTFHLRIPIYVARQLMRSNGEIVYNEVSRRYVSDPPTYHFPGAWRRKAESKKQGSGEGVVDQIRVPGALAEGFTGSPDHAYRAALRTCHDLYGAMIDGDIAPEQARIVLPTAMATEMWVTGTARAIKRVLGLRSHAHGQKNHAQAEIAEVSRAMRVEIDRDPALSAYFERSE